MRSFAHMRVFNFTPPSYRHIRSLTSSNYKGADAAVFAVPMPHRMDMSIIQGLTPYPRGYEYFPGSGQATNVR